MDLLAETINVTVIAKGILLGFGGIGPAIAIGLIGAAYMNGVSRNPEADKFFGKLFVFIGLAEVFGILAILGFFIV